MGGPKDRDYGRLAAEFITGERSVREQAKDEGFAYSTLARAYRKKDPVTGLTVYDQRDAFRANKTDKALDLLADRDAVQTAARMEKILKVGDTVLDLFIKQAPNLEQQIADGKVPINVRDAVAAADLIRSVIGVKKPEEAKPSGPVSLLQLIQGQASAPVPITDLLAATRSKLPDPGADRGTAQGAAEATGD